MKKLFILALVTLCFVGMAQAALTQEPATVAIGAPAAYPVPSKYAPETEPPTSQVPAQPQETQPAVVPAQVPTPLPAAQPAQAQPEQTVAPQLTEAQRAQQAQEEAQKKELKDWGKCVCTGFIAPTLLSGLTAAVNKFGDFLPTSVSIPFTKKVFSLENTKKKFATLKFKKDDEIVKIVNAEGCGLLIDQIPYDQLKNIQGFCGTLSNVAQTLVTNKVTAFVDMTFGQIPVVGPMVVNGLNELIPAAMQGACLGQIANAVTKAQCKLPDSLKGGAFIAYIGSLSSCLANQIMPDPVQTAEKPVTKAAKAKALLARSFLLIPIYKKLFEQGGEIMRVVDAATALDAAENNVYGAVNAATIEALPFLNPTDILVAGGTVTSPTGAVTRVIGYKERLKNATPSTIDKDREIIKKKLDGLNSIGAKSVASVEDKLQKIMSTLASSVGESVAALFGVELIKTIIRAILSLVTVNEEKIRRCLVQNHATLSAVLAIAVGKGSPQQLTVQAEPLPDNADIYA